MSEVGSFFCHGSLLLRRLGHFFLLGPSFICGSPSFLACVGLAPVARAKATPAKSRHNTDSLKSFCHIIIFLFLFILVLYWVEKWAFLRFYRTPVPYSAALVSQTMWWIKWILVLKLMMAVWAFLGVCAPDKHTNIKASLKSFFAA